MFRLYTYYLGQLIYESGPKKFEEAAHKGSNVTGVANGHQDDFVSHFIIKILGDFKRKGFLPEYAPAVL